MCDLPTLGIFTKTVSQKELFLFCSFLFVIKFLGGATLQEQDRVFGKILDKGAFPEYFEMSAKFGLNDKRVDEL